MVESRRLRDIFSAMAAAQGQINLKQNKPESLDGRFELLVVNTRL